MDEFEDISHLNPENARTVEYHVPSRTMTFRDATVNGHWTRVRVAGRDFETAAGRAAARSVGRQPSAVVSVRDDGYRADAGTVTSYYHVTVATGPRRHGVTPVVTVRVSVDTTGTGYRTGWED